MTAMSDEQEAASFDEQQAVMTAALDKFFERNGVHQDLWKEDGALGNIQHLKSKFHRVRQQTEALAALPMELRTQEMLDQLADDVSDLINYAGFLLRNAREERYESEL
jgi:hypothetical protein